MRLVIDLYAVFFFFSKKMKYAFYLKDSRTIFFFRFYQILNMFYLKREFLEAPVHIDLLNLNFTKKHA